MSNAGQRQVVGALGSTDEFSELGCRSEELKGLLRTLSNQVADADRRHSDALRQMQGRLARLGGQSETLKASLPQEYASAFSRIEDGMAQLAERLTDTNRPYPNDAFSSVDPDEYSETVRQSEFRDRSIEDAEEPADLAVETAADRAWNEIDSPSSSFAEAETSMAPAVGQLHDDDDFKNDPDNPWDRQAADALSRLYDSPDIAQTLRDAGDAAPRTQPALGLAPGVADVGSPMALSARASDGERAWLEAKLADIAARVEHSLAELKPDSSLIVLGERFDQLEERFSTALDEVATRSDVEGLRLVEAHVNEIAAHLEQAQAQLARIDSIEGQFAELRDKLSDDQIVALFGGLVPTEEDLTRFAEDAATRVADRVVASLPMQMGSAVDMAGSVPSKPDTRLDEVRGLLNSLIDERRRSEVNTAEALETMQLAMQQVLDRMEAIEAGSAPQQPTSHPADRNLGSDRLRGGRVPDHGLLEGEVRTFAEEAKAAAARVSAGGRSSLVAPDPDLDFGRVGGPEASIMHGGPETEADRPTDEQLDRKQFLAMARQAAEKANAQAQVAAAAGQKGAAVAGAKAGQSIKDKLLKVPPEKTAKGVRPSMLLAASVAAFMLAGAGYYVLSGPKPRPSSPAVQRSSQPAQPAGKASRTAPALIEDDAAIVPPGGGLQKQNTEDVLERGPDQQEAAIEPTEGQGMQARHDRPATRATETDLSTGAIGIAVQDGRREPTMEELMRARHRAQLASLSEKTAQNAARTSAMPEAAVPAGMREMSPEAAAFGGASTSRAVEMPPLLIGPNSLRHAAAHGDPSAQFEVAARFAEGKGVPQSFEQAAVWYERAGTRGLAQAQYRLATLYERGLGVKGDLAKARAWYQRAALLGNLKAMHNLAVLSAGRDKGASDYAAAAQWFTEAAEHGLADSQFNLGILHENGLGMPKDPVTAYKWYALAAASGDKDAARRRDLLKPKLDKASLAAANDAVATWRQRPADPMANEPRVAGDAWKRRTAEQTR
jgi:localization factor PodJL